LRVAREKEDKSAVKWIGKVVGVKHPERALLTQKMIEKYDGELAMEWLTNNKESKYKLNYNFDIALLSIEI
jgi:hypothetical protein